MPNEAALLEQWADLLAPSIGRTGDELREQGLGALDFPSDSALRVTLQDGSFVQFEYALYALDRETHQIAVFTEHCGCHLYSSRGAVITRVRSEWLFADFEDGD